MSIVHDLAEAIVGDLTPDCGISKENKHRMESQALEEMLAGLSPAVRHRISQLWNDYEQAETAEAKLVKDFDKIEMLIQAFEYERDQGLNLERFFESTVCRLNSDFAKDLVKCLLSRRDKLKECSSNDPLSR